MIRRVAFKKAVTAGVLGALAWEAAARILSFAGAPIFDLVYLLGTMTVGQQSAVWQWWTAGMVLHSSVGAIWAIFYAYFFWSELDYRPVVQGLLFSLLPTVLAGLVMVPQMDLMHPAVLNGMMTRTGPFAAGVGVGGPLMLVIGHLVYGAVLGSMYTRPVGYPVGQRVLKHG